MTPSFSLGWSPESYSSAFPAKAMSLRLLNHPDGANDGKGGEGPTPTLSEAACLVVDIASLPASKMNIGKM
jgi:hypothetical protein